MSGTSAEYARLLQVLTAPGLSVGLMLARFDDPRVGRALWERARSEVEQRGRSVALLDLHAAGDEADILAQAAQASASAELVFIVGLESLLLEFGVKPRASQAIATFNFNRDLLPKRVGKPIVLWMSARAARAFALRAPDTFDVVQTTFEFPAEPAGAVEAARTPEWMRPPQLEERAHLEERLGQLVAQYEVLLGAQPRQAGDRAAQAASLELSLRHYGAAAEWTGRAADAYAASGELDDAAHQGYRRASISTYAGDYDDAEAALDEAGPHAEASGVLDRKLELCLARAWLRQRQERLDEALGLAEEARVEAEAHGHEGLRREALARVSEIREARGELGEALRLYQGQAQAIEGKVGRWPQRVKFDFKGMGKAVAKGVVDLCTNNWAGVAKDTVELAASLGLAQTAADQAGALLTRAMTRAVLELIDPYKMQFPKELATHEPEIAAQLRGQLDALELELDVDFLARPRELPFIDEVRERVQGWLEQVDLRGRRAETVAARLPSYFVHALHVEAAAHDYTRLFDALDTRFAAAWRDERSWLAYEDWVRRELDAPVFEEGFSLAQIFVWPRAYYVAGGEPRGPVHSRASASLPPDAAAGEDRPVHHLVWLHEALDAWLETAGADDCVRVISGDPGAGKTSFARMYGARRMQRGDRVLIVPLHHLELSSDLSASLASLCHMGEAYPELDLAAEPSLLLILDGLDELAKRGKVGARLADAFVQELWSMIERRNLGAKEPRLRVLLSGRPVAVADVARRFRREGQVLHLVPYALSSKLRAEASWEGSEALLQLDQRHQWWARYAEHSGQDPDPPRVFFDETWIETTSQPLLAYLFVLVYNASVAAGEPFDIGSSQNEVYARLIELVYTRDLAKREGGNPSQGGLTREEFSELLEDMALAAWHDRARVTTVAAIEALASPELVAKYRDAAGGLRSLFQAFYLRKHGRDHEGEDTFEFTHKSFAEYLTARRLVAELELAVDEIEARSAPRRGRRRAGKDDETLLRDWLGIFGPATLTRDILIFVYREVALRDEELVGRWQRSLTRLIEGVLERGAICEEPPSGLGVAELKRRTRNAEEALLALLCACAMKTKTISKIEWPNPHAFARWMRWLNQPPLGACTRLSLCYLDISGQNFDRLDLSTANLSNSQMRDVRARGAIFDGALFHKTSLINADLRSANLAGARLIRTDLTNASLGAAIMVESNLINVSLRGADLRFVNFARTFLTQTDLSDARMDNAALSTTRLLQGTELTELQLAVILGEPALSK